MAQYINKDALVAEIERQQRKLCLLAQSREVELRKNAAIQNGVYCSLLSFIDTLEVKEMDLIIHTIIAECCDWLAMSTNLSHDEIESCRNLMLTIKEEQFKEQKGEESVNEGLKETQKNIWRSLDEKPSFPISNDELLCSILVLYNNGNMFLYRYGKNGIPNDSLTPHFCDIMNAKWCYCKDVINK